MVVVEDGVNTLRRPQQIISAVGEQGRTGQAGISRRCAPPGDSSAIQRTSRPLTKDCRGLAYRIRLLTGLLTNL